MRADVPFDGHFDEPATRIYENDQNRGHRADTEPLPQAMERSHTPSRRPRPRSADLDPSPVHSESEKVDYEPPTLPPTLHLKKIL